MLVDTEILRAFAGQVDLAAADIDGADVGVKTSSAGDALPGSTTQWAVRSVGEHFTRMATTLSQNMTRMGTAVHRAGDTLEVADDALAGQKTSRRVLLQADVDGSDTEAFGVMSQAMDPSKIDGFRQLLTKLAEKRQVVVLTHDDRLPSAIRRSRAPARIVESRPANRCSTTPSPLPPTTRCLTRSRRPRSRCCAARRWRPQRKAHIAV